MVTLRKNAGLEYWVNLLFNFTSVNVRQVKFGLKCERVPHLSLSGESSLAPLLPFLTSGPELILGYDSIVGSPQSLSALPFLRRAWVAQPRAGSRPSEAP